MSGTEFPIIKCPLCGEGADLHHDIRASLVYSCVNCMHEWQIDPAEETPQPLVALPERSRTPSRTSGLGLADYELFRSGDGDLIRRSPRSRHGG